MSESAINNLTLRIKTQYRPTGERILHSLLLKPDNLEQVIYQVIEEMNPAGNISVSRLELDLGTLSLTQFETEFNSRLAKALMENLLRLPAEPRPASVLTAEPAVQQARLQAEPAVRQARLQAEPAVQQAQLQAEPENLYPLAISCLQQDELQCLLVNYRSDQLLHLLKRLLNHREKYQEALPHYACSRVTASRLAIAALAFLLNDKEGLSWLRNNALSVNQLDTWQKAIASGEIAAEQVLALLTEGTRHNATVTDRWLRPLWQRKAVRRVIQRYAGTETMQDIDARFNPMSRQQRVARNQPQGADRGRVPISSAGLVLLWPILPQLFAHIALIEEGQFVGDASRWQAVQSLHYLAWGEEYPAAESFPPGQLLCGIDPGISQLAVTPLNAQQQHQIDAWLTAVGQQLPAWEKFSLTDIRQLFLQRPGEIITQTEPPQIVVKSESFDLLLSDWPWPLTLVQLPWLEQPFTLIWPVNGQQG